MTRSRTTHYWKTAAGSNSEAVDSARAAVPAFNTFFDGLEEAPKSTRNWLESAAVHDKIFAESQQRYL